MTPIRNSSQMQKLVRGSNDEFYVGAGKGSRIFSRDKDLDGRKLKTAQWLASLGEMSSSYEEERAKMVPWFLWGLKTEFWRINKLDSSGKVHETV